MESLIGLGFFYLLANVAQTVFIPELEIWNHKCIPLVVSKYCAIGAHVGDCGTLPWRRY